MVESANLFEKLSDEDLEILMEYCDLIQAEKSKVILNQGDVDDGCVYLIIVGKVQVYISDQNSKKNVVLTDLKNGEIFGEFSLFTQEARSANVLALEYTELLKIDLERIELMFEKFPRMAFDLVKHIAREASTKFLRRD